MLHNYTTKMCRTVFHTSNMLHKYIMGTDAESTETQYEDVYLVYQHNTTHSPSSKITLPRVGQCAVLPHHHHCDSHSLSPGPLHGYAKVQPIPYNVDTSVKWLSEVLGLGVSFHAKGLYNNIMGFWPIPGFCRFWILHLWWAISFKILWTQTIFDFTSYLLTFSP